MSIYLDHAATTPVAPEVVDVMVPLLRDGWGNPSSAHHQGRRARSAVDDARDALAEVLRCAPRELTFTSGGTEADNLALRGVVERWGAERGRHLVVSAIEHEAVLETASRLHAMGAADVTVVACDAGGHVDPSRVASAVRSDTVLVSLMLANNEVGTVQDVAAAAAAARRANPRVLVHTDAVQALGRLEVRPEALDVDLLSVSAHKVYGPKGTGALYARWGTALEAQLTGGGQERGRRSGTEHVAGIAGFAAAATLVEGERVHEQARQQALRDRLERIVLAEAADVEVAGAAGPRLPNLSALLVPGVAGEPLVAALDLAGIAVSGGSACSSGAAQPSHVLAAMGHDPGRTALLRVSVGRGTEEAEVETAARAIVAAVGRAVASGCGRGEWRRAG